jgi:hypothetical protein
MKENKMKFLVINNGQEKIVDNLKDYFKELTQEGVTIDSVEDGTIKTSSGEIAFYILNTEGVAATFISEIEVYRDELRTSVAMLQAQGIVINKTELNKIGKQFKFLPDGKKEVKEDPVKETVEKQPETNTPEVSEDEIPI